jgi:multidrug resistance efflux pump
MDTVINGIARDYTQASSLVRELKSAGFAKEQISIGDVARPRVGVRALASNGDVPEVDLFQRKLVRGSSLISVHAESSDEIQRAREVFERAGAESTAIAWALSSAQRADGPSVQRAEAPSVQRAEASSAQRANASPSDEFVGAAPLHRRI